MAEEYWEKESEIVINAQQLIPESDNLLEQIQNTYNYVVETLEYSHEKYTTTQDMVRKNHFQAHPRYVWNTLTV